MDKYMQCKDILFQSWIENWQQVVYCTEIFENRTNTNKRIKGSVLVDLDWRLAMNFHINGTLWGGKHIYTVYGVKRERENVSVNHL